MNKLENVIDKLCIKQWSVGFAHAKIGQILSRGMQDIEINWLPVSHDDRFYADPFIFHDDQKRLYVAYEDFDAKDHYGKISYSLINKQFEVEQTGLLLDTGSHLSYPNTYKYKGKRYILPEASKAGDLIAYEFDFTTKTLKNPFTILSGAPLLDATILFYQNKYWLFATKRGPDSNRTLHIYHSHRWDGDYQPHAANPVKIDLAGSRPAGHFFTYMGEIYRPTQHSVDYYGKSIQINKLVVLNEDEFAEEPVIMLQAPKTAAYNFAMHTINFSNDVMVIDGLRRIFNPIKQLKTRLKKAG